MKPRRPKTRPVSFRVTVDEHNRLLSAAGNRSLGDYIRDRLFGNEAPPRRVRIPTSDARHLALVLAALGHSEIAPSLRDLSRAAVMGALPVTTETEVAIRSACSATVQMRSDLMRALGLIEGATS